MKPESDNKFQPSPSATNRTVTNAAGTVSTTAVVYDTLGNAVTNETTYGNLTAVTATAYDSQGRAVSQTDVLGNPVFTAYDRAGNVTAQSGATYPVAYTYDTAGRRTSMRTFRDENDDGDVTQWRYDAATGLLTNKVYADGSRIVYTHTPDGKPLRTTWARGAWKENAYDALGQLATITYSGKVPKVSLARNAFGTVTNVSCASGLVYGFAVNDRQIVTNETVVSGAGASTNTLTRLLDAFDRPAGLLLDSGYALFYGRDSEHRITAVSNAAFTAQYAYTNGYVTGHTLTLPNGNTLARVMMRDPHRPGLLTGITNLFNGASVSSLAYDYDIAGRVTNRNDDAFGYNARSEVIGAAMGTNSYGYAYDAIGNRVFSAVNAVTNTYTANSLNQYTAVGSVSPVYDADGNMRWDGRMWHTWDAENRLTRSEPGWDGATNGAVMVDNRYDYRHRRCSKTVRRLTGRGAGYPFDPSQGGTWDVVETRTFIYDGWNLTAEVVVDAQAGTTNVTRYLWGPDVSGTLQGAGGVGGLLAVIRSDGTFFPCYDANGNVTDYVDGAGNIRAHYEYSPFGETIAQSGDLADTFKFRFSTKYWDEETRSYYYGYRFYSPELMRWLNRDPIGDRGGLNEYGFVGNAPMNRIDRLGLFPLTRDLEIELDYQKVPVRKNENVTLFAKTWARGPDIFETTDAEIVREGKCCARVKRASKRKMVIRAHWLSEDAIGRFVTAKGYDVIIEHEQKRDGALIAGFTAYYGPVSGLGAEATKCGKVCRKGGFKAAKWALEDYLGTIASDAWSQFYDYSIRAQGDIERENRFGNAIFVMQNGNLLFDGHRNS